MAKSTPLARYAAAFLSAGALAILISSCASTPTPQAVSDPTTTGFSHVHGLGYDKTTGRIYAAAHNGVWLLPTENLPTTFGNGKSNAEPTGEPQQIADLAQDFMGFFVTDTGLLLASGHPDPNEKPTLNPTNLGLIKSTDGAHSWKSVSLRAEADFHDLAAVPLPTGKLRIYGYDATRSTIRVSDDSGRTWTDGATLELRDLAADRTNPNRVLATSANGLMISDNAAKTFTLVGKAPSLYLVDALDLASGGGFMGVDIDGTIWHSGDDGTWISAGATQGVPEALVFVGGETPWVLFSDDSGVVASDDFGFTWTHLVAPPTSASSYRESRTNS